MVISLPRDTTLHSSTFVVDPHDNCPSARILYSSLSGSIVHLEKLCFENKPMSILVGSQRAMRKTGGGRNDVACISVSMTDRTTSLSNFVVSDLSVLQLALK